MAIDLLVPLPDPPLPTDSEEIFDSKAGTTLTAQQYLVNVDINGKLIPGINAAVVEIAASKDAAATSAGAASDSATAANASKNAAAAQVGLAAEQVELAAGQVTLAVAAKNETAAIAQAVGVAAGLPPERVPFSVLQINAAGAVSWGYGLPDRAAAKVGQSLILGAGKVPSWGYAGQQIGDTLVTSRNPGTLYLPADGSIRLQSAYPDLFAQIGTLNTNNGVSWNFATQFAAAATMNTVCPLSDPGAFLAGGGDGSTGKTLYRTTNGGLNWNNISANWGGSSQIVSLGSNKSGGVVIGTDAGGTAFRSADNGNTWAIVPTAFGGAVGNRCVSDESMTWLLSFANGKVKRSGDNGITFADVVWPGGATATRAICYLGSNRWIIIQSASAYISTDGGVTWGTAIPTGAAGSIYAVDSDLLGTLVAVGDNGAIRRSTDNGVTWSPAQGDLGTINFKSVTTDRAGTWIACGIGGSIRRSSDNGLTWVAVGAGLTTVQLRGVATDKVGNWNVVGDSGSNLRNNPAYNFDKNTQFVLPTQVASMGLKAYIKALEAA